MRQYNEFFVVPTFAELQQLFLQARSEEAKQWHMPLFRLLLMGDNVDHINWVYFQQLGDMGLWQSHIDGEAFTPDELNMADAIVLEWFSKGKTGKLKKLLGKYGPGWGLTTETRDSQTGRDDVNRFFNQNAPLAMDYAVARGDFGIAHGIYREYGAVFASRIGDEAFCNKIDAVAAEAMARGQDSDLEQMY